jgi:MGT family glycosyltransferase
VLHDFMAWGGRFYGSKHGIEQARLFPSYGINESFSIQARFPLATFEDEKVIEMVGKLAALLPEYGLDPDPMAFFQDIPELGIIFMPRAFHYDGDTFDERFVFAGPCLRDRSGFQGSWEPRHPERPTLLVSLGTAATGWAEFFPLAVEAFADSPYEVVLATGDHVTPEELGELPAHITAQRHVPQLDVLTRSTVFVTHGGMNSVMESLYHGVPMVVIPQMNEQTANGLRVEELGLGVHLERDAVKAEVLRDAVDRVAGDTEIAARVRALSDEMKAVDGPVVAADVIESYLARK